MRIQLTDSEKQIVTNYLHSNSLQEVTEHLGYQRIQTWDIDNLHALPKVKFDKLYIRNGMVYEYEGWETLDGFVSTATGNLILKKIGYIIVE